ncbi:nicotinate-nucleotide--dimethylbenzimidazole phosphoribosyltransferase [Streptomyces sp. NPDC007904]|uniref:nicotinate-nucleotide--dimethylbenzimidazole phosphoribosyltransferase n=1 Tax=Streptomyces sp. NPDC007904 TaxID=3364787 RepID=UPI0036F11806
MTDTGQVPGEGLPENAGMVEQPGVPAPDAYTYLSDTPAEEEDLLLPGAQGAWGNEVAPPAPEPIVETVHEPGPHEMSGRDSGSVDLGGVRLPDAAHEQTAPAAPRRPLHLGPPIPSASAGPVRSLADRGPADVPVRHPGPPTLGPEYLDVPRSREAAAPQAAAPWGAQATVGEGAAPAETVVPASEPQPVGAAQAVVARVATEAGAGRTQTPPAQAAPATGTGHDTTAVTADGQGAPVTGEAGTAVQSAVTGAAGGAGQDTVQGPAPAESPEREPALAPAPEPAPPTAAPEDAEAPAAPPAARTPETEAAVSEAAVPGSALPGAPDTAPEATRPEAGTAEAEPGSGTTGRAAVAQGPEPTAPAAPAPGTDTGATAQDPADVAPQDPAGALPQDPAEAAGEATDHAPAPQEPVPAGPDAPHTPGVTADAVPVAEVVEDAVPATEPAGDPVPGTHTAPPAPGAAEAPAGVAPEAAAPAPGPEGSAPVAEPPVAHPADTAPPAPTPETAVTPDTAETGPRAADGSPSAAPSEQAPVAVTEQPLQQAGAEPVTHPVQDTGHTPAAPPVPAGPQDTWTPAPAQPGPVDAGTPVADAAPPVVPAAGAAEAPAPPHAAPAAPAPTAGPSGEPVPGDTAAPLPGTVHAAPGPDQPLGRFVPVEGTVPTTPHLAPTPPQGVAAPAEDVPAPEAAVTVPAPREAGPRAGAHAVPVASGPEPDPGLVQHADDLDTRGAGVEERAAERQDQDQDQEAESEEGSVAVADAVQPSGPAAPGYDDAEREAVLKVMRERRDIRNGFRSDPIPHEVLLRVLEAAHTAPSVGHSQPWDFVVIRSAETRRSMHELAMRQRDAYATSLPKGRAKQFKELKIEAILDTPVNIVVTADPTRGGRHTLGRHTQPQMAPYSSALAVENLWLAARAEGLGVGWVSFFDEREMVRALGLPEHLEVVAYLCVGYVDEFPDEPELMQAGWSKRRPLSWVVHEETYGRRALPGEEPHDLLAETVAQIRPLDAKALGEAWERQKRMTKPAGALGMLEIISAQLSGLSRQCPPPIPEPAAVAIFAGDHGVHAQGVTPWPQEVTAQMVANFLGGGAVCNAFAAQVGAEVCVVDVGVASDLPATPGLLPRKIRGGTSDMTTGPAMTREEAKKAIEVGIETARDLVAAGNKALLTGEMGIANTTASAALISVYTGADPAEVTGRGTGINDETLARKTEVVRRALELHQPDPADPVGVLAAVGGFEHAAMVGLLLGGASLRTPVILDGVSAGAAALVARAIAPEVLAACIAGHRSAEPGHVAALNKLGLRPLVDLDLRLGEGTGALLALPLVQSTARAMHEVATFDSAGVTEK